MKFFNMVLVNCKKYFKDYKNIVLMFILPIAVVSLINGLGNHNDDSKSLDIKIGILNLDKGSLGKELIEDLKVESVYEDKEVALENLKKYSIISFYEIPEDFTEKINESKKPGINAYKLEEGNNTKFFEVQMEEKLNQLVKFQILKDGNLIKDKGEINKNLINIEYNVEKGIVNSVEFMPIVLIMFFIVSFSCSISTDLLKLRKEKILERFSSTSNKGYQIIGSIYLSMIIAQCTMYTAAFVVMKVIFKFKFANFGILVLNIMLMSIVAISLAIMINRIFKEPGVGTVVINLISIAMFFLYITGGMGENTKDIPQIIVTLSKFTPFYWALGSIEKSVLFPNVFILLLIALVFFSAGSIRYSNFAKE